MASQDTLGANTQTQLMLAGSYTLDKMYFGALATHIKDYKGSTNSYKGYELAAKYTLNDKVEFTTTYNLGKVESATVTDYISAEAGYTFNANLTSFAIYKLNFADKSDVAEGNHGVVHSSDTDDQLELGLKYTF